MKIEEKKKLLEKIDQESKALGKKWQDLNQEIITKQNELKAIDKAHWSKICEYEDLEKQIAEGDESEFY